MDINKERESIKWCQNGTLLLLLTVLFRGNHSRSDFLYLTDYILHIHDPEPPLLPASLLRLPHFQSHVFYLTSTELHAQILVL